MTVQPSSTGSTYLSKKLREISGHLFNKTVGDGAVESGLLRAAADEMERLSAAAQQRPNRDELLRGLAAFFEESVHLVWSNEEIASCLTDMIGQIAQPTRGGDQGEAVAWRWQEKTWGDHWIYDPAVEWREANEADPTLNFQPLFAAPQPTTAGYTEKAYHSLREEFVAGKPVWRIIWIVPERRTIISEFGSDRERAEESFRALALPSTQPLPPDWKRAAATDRCAGCGYPLSEHSYNGACYGVCGEFVSAHSSTQSGGGK